MTTPTSFPSPRAVAESLCHAGNTRDYDAFFALGTPDATWWTVASRRDPSANEGKKRFADMRPAVEANLGQFKSFEFTTVDITVGPTVRAAGEKSEEGTTKVVIEGTGRGESATGIPYHNDLVMVLTVRQGKIIAIREWFDTKEFEVYLDAVKQSK